MQQIKNDKWLPPVAIAAINIILLFVINAMIPTLLIPPTTTTLALATYASVAAGAFAGAIVIQRTHFKFIQEVLISATLAFGITALLYGLLAQAFTNYSIALWLSAFIAGAIGKAVFKKRL